MFEDAPEIRCSQNNDAVFYARIARQFLLGVKSRDGEVFKPPHDVIKITGLGSTVSQCVSVVGRVTSQNIARVLNVHTGFLPIKECSDGSSRGIAQTTVVLQRVAD